MSARTRIETALEPSGREGDLAMSVSSIDRTARCAMKAAFTVSALLAGLLHPEIARATGACTMNFSNPLSIHDIYAQARESFAFNTSFNTSGHIDLCANAAPGEPCWDYGAYCSEQEIQVKDISGYNHYHLGFTDPAIDQTFTHCFPQDPGDGYGPGFMKWVNGQCVFPNYDFEPRVLLSHSPDQWINFWMGPIGSTPGILFDFAGITVGGSTTIQFWYETTSGWFVANLTPGVWTAPNIPVYSIEISAASGQTQAYEIDSISFFEQD